MTAVYKRQARCTSWTQILGEIHTNTHNKKKNKMFLFCFKVGAMWNISGILACKSVIRASPEDFGTLVAMVLNNKISMHSFFDTERLIIFPGIYYRTQSTYGITRAHEKTSSLLKIDWGYYFFLAYLGRKGKTVSGPFRVVSYLSSFALSVLSGCIFHICILQLL